MSGPLERTDPEVYAAIQRETGRQADIQTRTLSLHGRERERAVESAHFLTDDIHAHATAGNRAGLIAC